MIMLEVVVSDVRLTEIEAMMIVTKTKIGITYLILIKNVFSFSSIFTRPIETMKM